MIASLRGKLLAKSAESAVIECAGVGYGVFMAIGALAKLGQVGSEVQILVHTHLTQDALRLFGFSEESEKRVFEILISTSGVGPKLALAVLSILSPDELAGAVATADKSILTRVPGVGAKKAERLLVDLKGRLDDVAIGPMRPKSAPRATLLDDLMSALVNLGFQPKDADRAAKTVTHDHPEERDLAVLVREALRSSSRN
ncbi:MAG: Holliday junction branch migration protein RuvA [Myxococcota bacterium]|nr:Holliday junction branch migration protein RuvA [Myxococcota bacterium]